ncbi:MAG: ATP-binding protein [Candidatus Zhuqueibacterota bacterium]
MKTIALPPLIIATLSFYIGLYHLIIYFKGGVKYRKDLAFALACFFIGMNDIVIAFLYNSSTVAEGSFWQSKQPFFYSMGALLLIWFIHEYVNVGRKIPLRIFSAIIVSACVFTLFDSSPLSWQFDHPMVKTVHLPFDVEIVYNEIKGGPVTDLLSMTSIFSVLIFLAIATVKTYLLHRSKRKTFPFFLSFALLVLAASNDYAVYKQYYSSIYLFEYSYLGLILLMTTSLSKGVLESAFMRDALKSERDLLQSLLDNIPDLIYFKDKAKQYIRINKAFTSLPGVNAQEDILGKTDYEIFTREFAEKSFLDDEYIRATKQPIIGKIENETLPNGNSRWVSMTKVPILNDAGELDKIVGISRDITRIKLTSEALEKAKLAAESANRVKSQFLANMSHELRTPMNGIVGMLELALTSMSGKQQDFLKTARASAAELLDLLNKLLDFTDIENQNLGLAPVNFNLKQLIEETLDNFRPKAQLKRIDILCQINPDVPLLVKGDAVRLKQIFQELLDNSLKFTERGTITFSVDLPDEFRKNVISRKCNIDQIVLQFSIADTGIGIPKDKVEFIFDCFYQVDGTFTRRYGGTGIGLSISRKLIHLMGGEIRVESETDRGSTFHFTINVDKVELKQAVEPQEPAVVVLEKKNYTILIVEDNIINQKVTSMILVNVGHQTLIANNGVEALDILTRNSHIDLILMDIQMPEMDGFETTRRIRSGSVPAIDPEIPIIALTAHASKSDRDKCLSFGMNDFLTKPVEPESLFRAIEQVTVVSVNAAQQA